MKFENFEPVFSPTQYPMPDIPVYEMHEGTLKIASTTAPKKASSHAMYLLERGVRTIDFFLIGAAAGQQAMKAMTLFRFRVEDDTRFSCSLAFSPLRYQTETKDPQTGQRIFKSAAVWRTYIINTPTPDTRNETSEEKP